MTALWSPLLLASQTTLCDPPLQHRSPQHQTHKIQTYQLIYIHYICMMLSASPCLAFVHMDQANGLFQLIQSSALAFLFTFYLTVSPHLAA